MKNLIKKLTEAFGPSGYESKIREIITEEVKPYADQINTDALGNLIVKKGSLKPGGKKIMVSAHMDEIGVIASHVTENGFVYLAFLGGVRPLTCFGSRVQFINGHEGVIYAETDKMGDVPTLAQLYADVGATCRADCPVKPGDTGVFVRPFLDLGNRIVGKAMDDRLGCAIAIETLKKMQDSPNEVYFVFSAQEEVGLRGATTAAYAINPDVGIAIDVTLAADTPHGDKGNMELAKGPCIKARDNSLVAHPKVIEAMKSAAVKAAVPYQMEVLRFAGTDAGAIQMARSGVPCGCLSIACRYVHSPSEMVDIRDTEQGIALLVKLVENPLNL